MKRLFLAAALALSACSTTPAGTPAVTSTISVSQAVYTAEGGYVAAARGMAAYTSGAFGKPDPAVVAKMRSADAVAYALLVPIRADAQAGQTVAQTSVDALAAAVAQFAGINAAAGVK